MLGNQEQQHTKSWGKIPCVPLPCLCVFLSITPLGFNGESRLLLLLSELFTLLTWEIAKVSAVGPALACTWLLVWYLWPKNHTIRSLVVASGCNWPLGIPEPPMGQWAEPAAWSFLDWPRAGSQGKLWCQYLSSTQWRFPVTRENKPAMLEHWHCGLNYQQIKLHMVGFSFSIYCY